jgi:DNA-3-methyladenine glycosylase II
MAGLESAEIGAARLHLAGLDQALARAHAATPPFVWRNWEAGYAGLLRVIVGQQVSTASAAAIWARLQAGLAGQPSAEGVLGLDIEALRAFGLSLPKARYALAIAAAEKSGAVVFEHLPHLDDEAALAALTGLAGVGPWTAEVYLTFCEGRTDLFPAADIALQEALRLADGAERRLDAGRLRLRAEAWRPHRGVAAHLLWAYYRAVRRGEIDPGQACG